MGYPFDIAKRYLLTRRQVSLISIITTISITGICLGVASLIVVLSVMNGFFNLVRDMLVSFDPHVRIESAEGGRMTSPDSVIAVAKRTMHVEFATPYVEGKALFAHKGSSEVNKVVIVRGVDEATMGGVSQVVGNITYGSFDLARRGGRPGILVGLSLANRLSVLPGSNSGSGGSSDIALMSAPGIERMFTQMVGLPPVSVFEVRGLFQIEQAYDESHVFISLEEGRRLLRMKKGDVTGVELRLDNLDNASTVKETMEAALPPGRYKVQTWYDLQRSLYDVMRLEKLGASLVLALIVFVAAFNIVGSLTMVVMEKRRDLGVLRALGATAKSIRRIFLIEGLLIGGIGSGLGLLLGLGLCYLQDRFGFVKLSGADSFIINSYPVSVEWLDVAMIVVLALLLCAGAALYPAYRAARLQPTAAISGNR